MSLKQHLVTLAIFLLAGLAGGGLAFALVKLGLVTGGT